MDIELKIKMKLPDECLEMSDDELRDVLWEAYVKYVTVHHSIDAMKWCCKGKIGTENEDSGAKILMTHHNTWADISHKSEFEVVRNKEKCE